MYIIEYHSAIAKNEILPFAATWMNLENIILSLSKSDRERQILYDIILDAWGWCTGTTQRNGMGREEGGGFRMGNTCIPVADSF